MNKLLLLCAVASIGGALWLVSRADAQQKRQTSPAQAATPQETSEQEAEAAIRKAATEFTEAFDDGDAESLAKHFTMDGVYIDEDGRRCEGRAAIQREYETL